jgi:hypothetical protein
MNEPYHGHEDSAHEALADEPVTLVDCGCEARVHADGSGIEIDYCDVHAAAPHVKHKLYEIQLSLGAVFHALSNEDDAGLGAELLEPILEDIAELAK